MIYLLDGTHDENEWQVFNTLAIKKRLRILVSLFTFRRGRRQAASLVSISQLKNWNSGAGQAFKRLAVSFLPKLTHLYYYFTIRNCLTRC
jgi:hypothetical protein